LCSETVSQSASTWQGWKSSVSAFTTGTPAYAAISSRSAWWNVRQAIADVIRPSTRAVSATDSPRPIWVLPVSRTSGTPPRSAMPTENETRVRVDALSNRTATV
jgi:hypothetical protein